MLEIIIRNKTLNSRKHQSMEIPLRQTASAWTLKNPPSHTTAEDQHIQTSSPQPSDIQAEQPRKDWNKKENNLFISFWLKMFIEKPYEDYTEYSPLRRSNHAKELSQYISFMAQKLNFQAKRTTEQCKSKFSTQKRKFLKSKHKNKEAQQKKFIDYMIEEAEQIKPKPFFIKEQLKEVKLALNSRSTYMQTKQELFSLEKSSENKWLNEEIIKLLNLQMSNLFIKDESQENDMME